MPNATLLCYLRVCPRVALSTFSPGACDFECLLIDAYRRGGLGSKCTLMSENTERCTQDVFQEREQEIGSGPHNADSLMKRTGWRIQGKKGPDR